MAKKAVATLHVAGSRNTVKVIKMVKSPDTGSYSFKEEMVVLDKVNEYLKK